MSPERQIIVIAEFCGWKNCKHIGEYGVYADNPKHPPHAAARINVPEYIYDLNAMRKAEKMLTDDQFPAYHHNLLVITQPETPASHVHIFRAFISATAGQKAQALIRALGKWEEDT